MSESEKSFTVSDRRHFTPDGRPREGEAGARETDQLRAEPPPEVAAGGRERPVGGRVDFSSFLVSLAAQAGALLSGGSGEAAGEPGEALEGARSIISILEMLKDKTEGRRTEGEEALLADLLFQLRMAYLERKRTGES